MNTQATLPGIPEVVKLRKPLPNGFKVISRADTLEDIIKVIDEYFCNRFNTTLKTIKIVGYYKVMKLIHPSILEDLTFPHIVIHTAKGVFFGYQITDGQVVRY